MNDFYTYPVVVETAEDNGLGLYFVDFPGTAVIAPDFPTALRDAKMMLVDLILELLDQRKEIPVASEPDSIQLNDPSDRIVYVEIYLRPYADAEANKAVTINCTAPKWLKEAGNKANLNFSQLLQNSIKEALGIKYL
ncbi:putative RNase H-like HicB family nuclease [Paenibacillus polymyxa]